MIHLRGYINYGKSYGDSRNSNQLGRICPQTVLYATISRSKRSVKSFHHWIMLGGMCEMFPYYLYCRLCSHFEEEDGEERAESTTARLFDL